MRLFGDLGEEHGWRSVERMNERQGSSDIGDACVCAIALTGR